MLGQRQKDSKEKDDLQSGGLQREQAGGREAERHIA
jgi:hypothetical protein